MVLWATVDFVPRHMYAHVMCMCMCGGLPMYVAGSALVVSKTLGGAMR